MSWDQLAKISQHGGKERVKISKAAKFESDLLKTYGDTAPQRRENFTNILYGGGKIAPPPYERQQNFAPL